ncbi:S53 family peptidase [Streptomyces sp. NBC_01433]|uniref:S53 family peptidase n=1 Tax=Streptomyces sp. NBC_01433 TaxID=2903864 RepID=UPI00225A2B23|nr:S53 family peptidase [Streptomyces sp. NBC_01433]MCX4681975.1 S53 family peptidase [Streptomyces sp. NBC_01433]
MDRKSAGTVRAGSDSVGEGFVALEGSERPPLPDVENVRPVSDSEHIEVTVMLRRLAPVSREYVTGPATLTHDQLAQRHGASPAEVTLVGRILARYGLQVTATNTGARQLHVAGTAASMAQAFGATLAYTSSLDPSTGERIVHRYRTGGLRVPAELDGLVTAVVGLDNRPQARPNLQRASVVAATSFTAIQVGNLYKFPAATDGTGQIIAFIELGGGFSTADLTAYYKGLGITGPVPIAVSVDGAVNNPGKNTNYDAEVMLDLQVAGALAPKAQQLVYFAPNSAQGFLDALTSAVHASPAPTAISISWGQYEEAWADATVDAMEDQIQDACALGITVCAASGDNGAVDGAPDGQRHCDYPASGYALACGGTSLTGNTSNNTITSETVWNNSSGATGGGVSNLWYVPDFQNAVTMPAGPTGPGRGVPDVAGNADPMTGYQIRLNGAAAVYGGTSAVAPLWAALICRLVQASGKHFGLIQTQLYTGATATTTAPGFRDITSGNNNGYSSTSGWDACTGLGTPNATTLLALLKN